MLSPMMKNVDDVMLDLSKAFDLIIYKRLIQKLKSNEITDELAEWFEILLRNREQRVVLGNVVTDWAKIMKEVPQNSVICPLFIVV